ncbi:MAG: rhodanese-like domain-containing protein [Gimesia chilikensis]|uniref:rhodanese-like domain-containing protein n=1 Tax=Gimesia chilikensis TaxID=2605989 RepID=UPI0037AA51C9
MQAMTTIGRNDLQQLLASCPSLLLLDVLPQNSYREYHLRGAINAPFDHRFDSEVSALCPDKSQTIVIYGMNFECPIASQALQRLGELGYENLFHYEPGKVDWKAALLPVEQGPAVRNSLEIEQAGKEQRFLFLLSLTQAPLFDLLQL